MRSYIVSGLVFVINIGSRMLTFSRTSSSERPRHSIDVIPKTASGKILRREMRDMAKKLPAETFTEKRKIVAKL